MSEPEKKKEEEKKPEEKKEEKKPEEEKKEEKKPEEGEGETKKDNVNASSAAAAAAGGGGEGEADSKNEKEQQQQQEQQQQGKEKTPQKGGKAAESPSPKKGGGGAAAAGVVRVICHVRNCTRKRKEGATLCDIHFHKKGPLTLLEGEEMWNDCSPAGQCSHFNCKCDRHPASLKGYCHPSNLPCDGKCEGDTTRIPAEPHRWRNSTNSAVANVEREKTPAELQAINEQLRKDVQEAKAKHSQTNQAAMEEINKLKLQIESLQSSGKESASVIKTNQKQMKQQEDEIGKLKKEVDKLKAERDKLKMNLEAAKAIVDVNKEENQLRVDQELAAVAAEAASASSSPSSGEKKEGATENAAAEGEKKKEEGENAGEKKEEEKEKAGGEEKKKENETTGTTGAIGTAARPGGENPGASI